MSLSKIALALLGVAVLGVPFAAVSLWAGESASAGASLPDSLWVPSNGPVEDGDRVTFRTTAFTLDGRPIETNEYSVAIILNATGSYRLKDPVEYNATVLVLGEEETLLGRTFETYLLGRVAGDRFQTPAIPANETFTGAEGAPHVLPRYFGPFPMVEVVDEAKFRQRFPNATVGSVVQVNARFYATVEAIEGGKVTYRFLVEDGQAVPLRSLGSTAYLTTLIAEDGLTFRDRLDIEEGNIFQRKNDKILNMANGIYTVLDVTEEAVVLQKLKAPDRGALFQDVRFSVEILSVEKRL
ncbi:MAG TPA: hypothetical protein VNZ52_04765 [Candidatus Thermoplasmatota archaeon]|nr:hypothetical protein [Candidatus Thermoplasmatota archaeon]